MDLKEPETGDGGTIPKCKHAGNIAIRIIIAHMDTERTGKSEVDHHIACWRTN
jgi:hypothetical protein